MQGFFLLFCFLGLWVLVVLDFLYLTQEGAHTPCNQKVVSCISHGDTQAACCQSTDLKLDYAILTQVQSIKIKWTKNKKTKIGKGLTRDL